MFGPLSISFWGIRRRRGRRALRLFVATAGSPTIWVVRRTVWNVVGLIHRYGIGPHAAPQRRRYCFHGGAARRNHHGDDLNLRSHRLPKYIGQNVAVRNADTERADAVNSHARGSLALLSDWLGIRLGAPLRNAEYGICVDVDRRRNRRRSARLFRCRRYRSKCQDGKRRRNPESHVTFNLPLGGSPKPATIEAVAGSPRNYGFLLDSTKYRNSPLPVRQHDCGIGPERLFVRLQASNEAVEFRVLAIGGCVDRRTQRVALAAKFLRLPVGFGE